jgi:DNA-directed RNA polymerase subunit omega
LNAEFCRKALEKVRNPNILVNLVSRRVRQLSTGGGAGSRPFVSETAGFGTADIALMEIFEDKLTFDPAEEVPLTDAAGKKRKRN